MRKLLRYAAGLLALLVLLLAGLALFVRSAPLPTYAVPAPPELEIPYGNSLALARGEKLVALSCATCHSDDGGGLAGKRFPEPAFGELHSGNITNHPTAGLGRYSDRELVQLLRTGVRPDGALLVPVMPRFFRMADADLAAIVAYLRSGTGPARADERVTPPPQLSMLARALMRFAFRPAAAPTGEIVAPAPEDAVAHGEYLANSVLDCYQCHSAAFDATSELVPAESEGYYGGGTPVPDHAGQPVRSANLTPHPERGLGRWTLADFDRAIRSRQRPDGRVLSDAMPLYAALSDDEVAAIWAFLQSLPALDHAVTAEE